MALEPLQWQIRNLVMGPGTTHRIMDATNPFTITVRADQGGPRAWNHGSWSGAEWGNERVVPLRVLVETETLADWLAAHQQLAAAFAPIGDEIGSVELRFEFGGSEFLLFGRPRMVEPETDLLGAGKSFTRCAFVAQDPRIYSGDLSTVQTGLPVQSGGLTVPGVVSSTPPYGLVLPGTAGANASTPDTPSLDITGDVTLIAEATPGSSWAPGTDMALTAKYDTGTNQRSYMLLLRADGSLRFNWSTDGATPSAEDSDALVTSVAASGRLAIRADLDVDVGGTTAEVTFWTGPSRHGPWTQLGTVQDAGATTTVHAGTAPLEAGSFSNGASSPFAGTIHAVEVWSGNPDAGGTLVAEPRFETQSDGAVGFTDAAGLTWTVNGAGEINGYVAAGGLLVPFTVDGVLTGGQAAMLNSGTTDSPVTFRIDGPVVSPVVVIQRPDGSIQQVRFDLTLASGQWLDVSTAARTALLNGLPQANQRGRAIWDMDPYPLPPGTSTLRYLAGGFNVTTMATASWRSAWW